MLCDCRQLGRRGEARLWGYESGLCCTRQHVKGLTLALLSMEAPLQPVHLSGALVSCCWCRNPDFDSKTSCSTAAWSF